MPVKNSTSKVFSVKLTLEKNELIVTCHIGGMQDSLHNITSNHFFVFAISATLPELLKKSGAEVDDLVQIDGSISTLHRNSVVRVTLNSIRVLEKKISQQKITKKAGLFYCYGRLWKSLFKRSDEILQNQGRAVVKNSCRPPVYQFLLFSFSSTGPGGSKTNPG